MRSNWSELILRAIDQTITPDEFEELQQALETDDQVRRQYLRAVHLSETLHEIAADEHESAGQSPTAGTRQIQATGKLAWDLRSPKLMALAASLLVLASATAFLLGKALVAPTGETQIAGEIGGDSQEKLIAGHATLRNAVEVNWGPESKTYREGDLLPDGILRLDSGLAEIDFFCGATLIVEGPAALDIESDWSVRMLNGRMRANVPPAARGFVVKAADSEIIDLGTEFAVDVTSDAARVEVIDGEVRIEGGKANGEHLLTGQQQWLAGDGVSESSIDLSTPLQLQQRHHDSRVLRFQQWQQFSSRLASDDRLIAYFPIARGVSQRRVPNQANETAVDESHLRDGLMIGPVGESAGRFGDMSKGLQFNRPGARVRTRIDGDFQAFTFACWAKIDSLKHRYNALFMGDGYENGEPHWQIRDDGRLMFSVMVDDTQDVRHFNETDQKVVRDAGLHRVYFSEPMWDYSKSGRWFHIAAVYDPVQRRVTQYVDGVEVADEAIADRFHIDTLHIGPAEIGNWGQPFRDTPWFAVRNLDGAVDELVIFNAALSANEVHDLYQQGKPLGH